MTVLARLTDALMIRDGSPTSTDLVLVDDWFAALRAKLK